jgi:hypothetical protein
MNLLLCVNFGDVLTIPKASGYAPIPKALGTARTCLQQAGAKSENVRRKYKKDDHTDKLMLMKRKIIFG